MENFDIGKTARTKIAIANETDAAPQRPVLEQIHLQMQNEITKMDTFITEINAKLQMIKREELDLPEPVFVESSCITDEMLRMLSLMNFHNSRLENCLNILSRIV